MDLLQFDCFKDLKRLEESAFDQLDENVLEASDENSIEKSQPPNVARVLW